MKPKQLVTLLVLGLLTTTCFAQKKIAERLMRGDTSLVLFKRAETQKYIVAAAIDRSTKMFYLLDRNGNTWDSLRMEPYDCDMVLRRQASPFDYYLAAQRQIRAYRNELIRQLREKGKLNSKSVYYEAALYEHPELGHTDSTSAIKGILTLEQENMRDSTYSWGITCDEPGSFTNGSIYAHNDADKPGDNYVRGDTLFYINPEITSRLHRAVLIDKAGGLDYYNRDGLKIWSFKLTAKSVAQLSKEDVFTYYLEYLEKSKQSIDRQVKASAKSSNVQYASLKQPGAFNLTEDQRLINKQLDFATAPDLKSLATRLKEASSHRPINGQWLGFLGMGSYTPPASWDSVGTRRYELDNHLGNVVATITDKRISTGGYFLPDISTAQDYYAFGALMPSRTYKADSNYRYGFNGKENDNEVKGIGNQQDYGMRIYDPRVGRFLSVDPLNPKYPELTPYQFASNKPIKYVDMDGLEAEEADEEIPERTPAEEEAVRNLKFPEQDPNYEQRQREIAKFDKLRETNPEEYFKKIDELTRPKVETDPIKKALNKLAWNRLFPPVETPEGPIEQNESVTSLNERIKVQNGAKLFRLGKTGSSKTGDEAQYWSTIDPRVDPVGYIKATGARVKIVDANFIETAIIRPQANFVTGLAAPNPSLPGSGGSIEVVIQPGGTQGNQIIPFVHK